MSTPPINFNSYRQNITAIIQAATKEDVDLFDEINSKNDQQTDSKQVDEESQKKPSLKNKPFPITDLIKDEGEGEIAQKLSSHWLKDAAIHIFHDPLRSFLELVVNALDASLPLDKGVGKFGLGFISILSFLDHPETDGCTINIETTTRRDADTLSTLTIDLFKDQETHQVIFKDGITQKQTGTTIAIQPKNGKFSQQTLEFLLHHCHALEFYEHGKIEVFFQGKTYLIGEGDQTFAQVTLANDGLIVHDQGCGISEDIAYKKLFIPSCSTKKPFKEKSKKINLPEFKIWKGKRDTKSHFLITINGVVVIDIPFKSPSDKDLLLKMPASTHLTLGRDAIENRADTINHLKLVIDELVKASIASKEEAILLFDFYEALKAWEARVPSIAESKLSHYLYLSVQKLFQNSDLIPFPLEQAEALQPILPMNKRLIPFPKDLLFENFSLFENFLEDHYQAEKRNDLIAGKYVLFTEIDKVTALGLKNWIFAPNSLLNSNPTKRSLRISLVTRFADDGKELDIVSKNNASLMPSSMVRMNSPKLFIFISGMDSIPYLLTYSWGSYDKFIEDNLRPLRERFKEDINPYFYVDQLFEIFKNAADAPFEEIWKKNSQILHERFRYINSICQDQRNFCEDLGTICKTSSLNEQIAVKMQSYIVFEENPLNKEFKYFIAVKSTFKEMSKIYQEKTSRKYGFLNFKDIKNHLLPISAAQASKLFFAWLLGQMGGLYDIKIFTHERTIWPPPQEITLEYLEYCLESFFISRSETRKKIIAAKSLSFQQQQGIWKVLEDFMGYKPYGPSAIKHILPLLLLKEKMSQELPDSLYKKFDLWVEKLLFLYRQFLEIKLGDVEITYGEKKSKVSEVLSKNQCAVCSSVDEIAKLLSSLKKSPLLFEKCLDLNLQEFAIRMDRQKRNGILSKSIDIYIENICCKNGIAFLSKAKAVGVDPLLIETALEQVNTSFELYMICLLFHKYEQLFIKVTDKEVAAMILCDVITIYLRKSRPSEEIKKYEEPHYFSDTYSSGSDRTIYYQNLLKPIFNYYDNISGSDQKGQRVYTTQAQAISDTICKKLFLADSFTSRQVIHAARNKSDFAKALQTGNLSLAIESARKQPKKSDLQMITQAVEHGSERSGIVASFTEAFQNSVDAIRSFLKEYPNAPQEKASVVLDVRIVEDKHRKLLLEIYDQIGMQSLKTLLADFLIPNYSEKGKESVGEMGNGSYQMYREAELVTLKTRTLEDPSRVYFLKIEPIRHHKTLEVIDLNHTCIDITEIEPEFVGTVLNVIMLAKKHQSNMGVVFELLSARNFIKNTFALANPPLGDKHTLRCSLRFPNDELLLEGIERDKPFKIETSRFCCYKLQNEEDFGYVLTDGYPFKPLEIFLVEEELLPATLAAELACGWCLNLPKGTYVPVQSRMRVHIEKETKEELKVFLLNWIYFRSCCKEKSGPKTGYFPHLESPCANFESVYPAPRAVSNHNLEKNVLTQGNFSSMEAFFVLYKPAFLQKSFLEFVDEGYATLVRPLQEKKSAFLKVRELTPESHDNSKLNFKFKIECREIEEKWLQGLIAKNHYEKMFLEVILIPWFTNKTQAFCFISPPNKTVKTHKIEAVEESKKQEIQSIALDEMQRKELLTTATYILTSYCKWYAIKNNMKKEPQISFIYNKEPMAGYYRSDENKIYINLEHLPLSSILKMGRKVASEKPLKNNPCISITYYSSGILNHELEHARRGSDCNLNSHARMEVDGKDLDFDACAAYFAKKAHIDGLFTLWAKDLQQIILPEKNTFDKLLEIENTCPEKLLTLMK